MERDKEFTCTGMHILVEIENYGKEQKVGNLFVPVLEQTRRGKVVECGISCVTIRPGDEIVWYGNPLDVIELNGRKCYVLTEKQVIGAYL